MQPLTFWYEYAVNPGKEDEFLDLVTTVGAPVRDKLMADGVFLAWGVQVPLLRMPGGHTHGIWYAVGDWSGIEKVDTAMRAQIAKLNEEAGKAGVTKKGAAAGQSVTARMMDAADVTKTRDCVTRDLVIGLSSSAPPVGRPPYTRFNFREREARQGHRLPQSVGKVQQAGAGETSGGWRGPSLRPFRRRSAHGRRLHAFHLV